MNIITILNFIGEKNTKYKLEVKGDNVKIPFEPGLRNKNLKKQGKWRDENYNGIVNFENGVINGEYVVYFNGLSEKIIKERGFFRDGEKHGEWIQYNFDGDIIFKGNYVDGKQVGEVVLCYDDGTIQDKGQYDQDGKKHGEWLHYYPSGELKSKENYTNGIGNGIFTRYYEGGQVKGKYNSVNGKREGEHIEYYPNGNVKMIINYKGGLRNGKTIEYLPNGWVSSEQEYVDDQIVSK